MDKPQKKGKTSHPLNFMVMVRSREITPPKKPPTINRPWYEAVEEKLRLHPILIQPPQIPDIREKTNRGKTRYGIQVFITYPCAKTSFW